MNFLVPVPPTLTDSSTVLNLVPTLQQIDNHLCIKMRYAQDRQEQHANSSHTPGPRFSMGNMMSLSTKNIKTAWPSKKLDNKHLGPITNTEEIS